MANLNLNFDALTKLKDWWGVLKSNFTVVNDAIDQHESAITSSVNEILAARKGELSLLDKINLIDSLINELNFTLGDSVSEIASARKGEANLGNKIDLIDSLIDINQIKTMLLSDAIEGTIQTPNLPVDNQLIHSKDGVTIRTDDYLTVDANTETETRTLNTGESVVFTYHNDTGITEVGDITYV